MMLFFKCLGPDGQVTTLRTEPRIPHVGEECPIGNIYIYILGYVGIMENQMETTI